MHVQRVLWLMATIAVGLLIYLILDWLARGKVPPVRIVGIGVETYNHHVFPPNTFGHRDAVAFQRLSEYDEEQFPSVNVVDSTLSGNELLATLRNSLPAPDGNSNNLIVFCSLHGIALASDAEEPSAYFFGIDAGSDSPERGFGTGQLISVKDLFATLRNAGEEVIAGWPDHVLVLIDSSRLGPNWRLGIFDSDSSFSDQVIDEAKRACEQNPKLTVLCAAAANESSWVSCRLDESSSGSVFGHFVMEGLKGEADGWNAGTSGAQRDSGQARDERVSCRELAAYVTHRVHDWAQKNRETSQTVEVFPETGEDFDLVQIRRDRKLPDASEVSSADAETKPESDAREDDTKSPPDKVTAADGDDAEARTEKTLSDSTDQTDRSDSSDVKKEDPTEDGEAADSTQRIKVVLKAEKERLFALWRQRDSLRVQGDAAAYAPVRWRRLQHSLLRTEQLLRGEDLEKARDELRDIDHLLGEIESQVAAAGLDAEKHERFASVSLGFASRFPTDPLDAELQKVLQSKLDAATQATPEDDKPFQELRSLVKVHPAAASAVLRWITQRARNLKDSGAEDYAKLRCFLNVFDDRDRLPAELVTVDGIVTLAEAAKNGRLPWSKELADLFHAAIELRVRFEQVCAECATVFPHVRSELTEADRALSAGELWLHVGGGTQGQSESWFKKASEQIEAAQDKGKAVQTAIRLRARLLAELPDRARQAADRAEADRNRILSPDDMRELCESLRDVESLPADMLPQSVRGMLTGDEPDLLRLFLDARRVGRLLASNEDTEAATSLDLENLNRLTRGITDRLNDHEKRLKNETDRARLWQESDELLSSPWLAAESRAELLEKVDFEPASAARITRSSGAWHAFWAVQTLSLSELLTTEEFEFVWRSLDQNTKPDVGANLWSVRLGQDVNRAWTELARELEKAPHRSHRKDLLGRVVFCRDADPVMTDGSYSQIVGQRIDDLLAFRDQVAARFRETLECEPAELDFGVGSTRTKDFRLTVQPRSGETRPRLKLAFEITGAVVRDKGPTGPTGVSLEVVELPDGTGPLVRPFELELPEESGGKRRVMTIALLDAQTDVPLDFRRVPVIPRIDPNQWLIEFRTPVEVEEKTPSDQIVRNRHIPAEADSDLPETELSVPPALTSELQACVIRPPGDLSQTVDVAVYGRSSEGRLRRIPLLKAENVSLASQSRFTALPLVPASEQDAAASTGNSGEKTPAGSDVTDGFVFEITPKGKPSFQRRVRIRHWTGEKFVRADDVRVSLHAGRLVVRVPRIERDDPLIPKKIAMKLLLPAELEALATAKSLEIPESAEKQTVEAYAVFPIETLDRFRKRPFQVFLSVAGIPHALGWEVRPDGGFRRVLGDPPIRIADPLDEAVVKRGDAISLHLQIDALLLDQQQRRETWSVVYQMESKTSGLSSPPVTREIRSSCEKKFLLTDAKNGILTLQSVVQDHVFEIPSTGQEGCFTLSVRLVAANGTTVGSDEIDIGIDHENSPPTITDFNVHGVAADGGEFRLDGEPMQVTVTAEDSQSGIRELTVGVDSDGDGKIGETEIAEKIALSNPLESRTVSRTVVIPPELLPKTPTVIDVLAQATNGLGTSSPKFASREVRFTQYGSLVMNLKGLSPIRRATITITDKATGRTIGTPLPAEQRQIARELSVGTYVVTLKGKREVTHEVTIQGNTAHELNLSLLDVY